MLGTITSGTRFPIGLTQSRIRSRLTEPFQRTAFGIGVSTLNFRQP